MYPSKYEYVNRWKLKHVLKYGSKWLRFKMLKFWQKIHARVWYSTWLWRLNDKLYVPSRCVNRWKLKHICCRNASTVESWDALDVGSKWLWLCRHWRGESRLLRYKLFWSHYVWYWNKYSNNWLLFLVIGITCCMFVRRDGRKRWYHTPREGGDTASSEVKSKEQEMVKRRALYNSYWIVVV